MPITKSIAMDSGVVVPSYSDDVLVTGATSRATYGSALGGCAAIVAQSEQGYGLFHASGSFAGSEQFSRWLSNLLKKLGDKIEFTIIDVQNASYSYVLSLTGRCEKFGFDMEKISISLNEKVKTQPIAVDRDGISSTDEGLLLKVSRMPVKELILPRKSKNIDLIIKITQRIQVAINELSDKIENKRGCFADTNGRINSLGQLKSLQRHLYQFIADNEDSENLLSKAFIEKTNLCISEYFDEKIERKTTETVGSLFEDLKRDITAILSDTLSERQSSQEESLQHPPNLFQREFVQPLILEEHDSVQESLNEL
ncbi:hypothetical protein Psal006b_03357 (plasmid) [Piscirickettsia salmonis]|uniref:Uncharacterized protein n=2 Tax=Bacteria TaxID=2 RepID=A0AAC8VL51_PISSA|nr:hypothetical protein [Piscirickettsia salmonis]AKP74877.1 hypothetical protein PSLF89_1p36 [Piscirickettsia salmonis LF-89 = ATCC VR-1361]ALB24515.1 hypothetical protein KU39_3p53 [Piscirickettsia salmonis]ALY04420.1 hypothetical protein AWE47_15955 [Piscirickettsia salmonis]AOS37065.1 hypothetical protein AVM72_17070 [Piscirickettsia salmonis]APS62190.1 hypothetical protein AVI53_16705 [Piscirickettsia salmonis]